MKTSALQGTTAHLRNHLLHHAYRTLESYLEHMNRYSSLGAEMAAKKGNAPFSFLDIVIRPRLTFFYNYFLRGGFLDGREGLLLHLYHANYVSWKYAKAWERSRTSRLLCTIWREWVPHPPRHLLARGWVGKNFQKSATLIDGGVCKLARKTRFLPG